MQLPRPLSLTPAAPLPLPGSQTAVLQLPHARAQTHSDTRACTPAAAALHNATPAPPQPASSVIPPARRRRAAGVTSSPSPSESLCSLCCMHPPPPRCVWGPLSRRGHSVRAGAPAKQSLAPRRLTAARAQLGERGADAGLRPPPPERTAAAGGPPTPRQPALTPASPAGQTLTDKE